MDIDTAIGIKPMVKKTTNKLKQFSNQISYNMIVIKTLGNCYYGIHSGNGLKAMICWPVLYLRNMKENKWQQNCGKRSMKNWETGNKSNRKDIGSRRWNGDLELPPK